MTLQIGDTLLDLGDPRVDALAGFSGSDRVHASSLYQPQLSSKPRGAGSTTKRLRRGWNTPAESCVLFTC
jgi:hypothetical protein